MVSISEYQFWALSLPGTVEMPHFEKPSFRVKNKIFGTYWEKEDKAVLMLTLTDQSVFCSYDNTIFYPVNGSWGKKGATFVNMKKVRKDIFKDALKCAYERVSRKK